MTLNNNPGVFLTFHCRGIIRYQRYPSEVQISHVHFLNARKSPFSRFEVPWCYSKAHSNHTALYQLGSWGDFIRKKLMEVYNLSVVISMMCLLFTPKFGEMIQVDWYFSNGLKQAARLSVVKSSTIFDLNPRCLSVPWLFRSFHFVLGTVPKLWYVAICSYEGEIPQLSSQCFIDLELSLDVSHIAGWIAGNSHRLRVTINYNYDCLYLEVLHE